MTNPVKLLSDDEVGKIEARRTRCLDNKDQSRLAEASILIASDIHALCATVRALRESETFWQERTRARTTEVERLQSQLAQVTQERQLCLQVQKRGIHSSVTCPCVVAMESNHESPQH